MQRTVLLCLLIGYVVATTTVNSATYSHSACQPSYDPRDDSKYPCVQPIQKFWANLEVQNNGPDDLSGGASVSIKSDECNNCFTSLQFNGDVSTLSVGQSMRVNVSFVVPSVPGQYFPQLTISFNGNSVVTHTFGIEVTCSNGKFCDGLERYVKGQCVSGNPPCDDGFDCTTDVCHESNHTCSRTVTDLVNCDRCLNDNDGCVGNCTGLTCGDDGCGGSCGSCSNSLVCGNEGSCIAYSSLTGTCLSPISLFKDDQIVYGFTTVSGDTSNGVHVYTPKCNTASTAREQFYTFTVPAGKTVGVDIRSIGYDTVLELTKTQCGGHSDDQFMKCSDDATPPSNLGSRVSALLTEGKYFVMVDGYSGVDFGPFTLELRFRDGCAPSCEGRFCGSDGCGGTCGECGADESCSGFNRCLANNCQPICNATVVCGDDGCEGDCGTCNTGVGELCVFDTRSCKMFPICDHMRPVCSGCTSSQYCGSDCECYDINAPIPDLVINADKLRSEIIFESKTFDNASCAVYEKCVEGLGERRLMRFTVEVINQGLAALTAPPPGTNPQLFQWSPCHGHFHFTKFAEYFLLSMDGKVVKSGRKQAYCMLDSHMILEGPNVPCKGPYSCSEQGVSSGWSDVYGNDLDCQWLDVTNITPGDYQLYIAVNNERLFHEMSFENNEAIIPLTLTAEQLAYTPTPIAVAVPVQKTSSAVSLTVALVTLTTALLAL